MHNINTFEGGAGGDWIPTLHQKRLSKKHESKHRRSLLFMMTDVLSFSNINMSKN